MPRGDGTGPMGMGSMTGRAAGFCAGFDRSGFKNYYGGRGFGGSFGRGMGRGLWRGMARWDFADVAPYEVPTYGAVPYGPAIYNPNQEMEILQNQAKVLGNQLDQIRKRISDLEAEAKKASK